MGSYKIIIACMAIFILLFAFNGSALPPIKYNPDSTPIFEFNNFSLINKINSSYQVKNETIEVPFNKFMAVNNFIYLSNFRSSNLLVDYEFRVYQVAKNPPKITAGSTYTLNESTGEWDEVDVQKKEEAISTTNAEINLTEIDDNLIPPLSNQIEFQAKYEIKNPEITQFTPFMFELGEWPKKIGNGDIDEVLDFQLMQNLLISGDYQHLIISKNIDSFNYNIIKRNNSYIILIEKDVKDVEKDLLKVFLRPIIIEPDIKIEDIDIGNPKESLNFKPKIIFEGQNENITQFNFTYPSKNGEITETVYLDKNGIIEFNKYVVSRGKKAYYPFDKYESKIEIYPPLLVKQEQDLEMPYNSDLMGKAQINNNELNITFQRDCLDIIAYFAILIIGLSPIMIPLFKKEISIPFGVGLLVQIATFYINNNLRYIISIGSIVSIILFFIVLLITIKPQMPNLYHKK